MGSEAMLLNRMDSLDDFGTDEEGASQRPRRKRAACIDSETEDEDAQPTGAQSRPVSKTMATSKQQPSKRKRVSDVPDRTSKRTKVIKSSGSSEVEVENLADGPTGEKEDDVMNQDSQGEETLEVEQNLFYPSDEDSPTRPR